MSKHPFLEVTYRKGKPVAGYLCLSAHAPDMHCRTEQVRPNVLIDIDDEGEAMGIEFLAPGAVTPEDVQAIVERLHGISVPTEDLSPIMA